MAETNGTFLKYVLGLLGALSAAGIIALVVLNADYRAHVAADTKAMEAVTEDIGEIKDDVKDFNDQLDSLKDRSVRHGIILESIADTVEAPIPSKARPARPAR